MKPQKRVVRTVQLSQDAWDQAEVYYERTGLPKTVLLDRLLAWFGTLTPTEQMAVLDRNPAVKRELAVDILTKMAAGGFQDPAKLRSATAGMTLEQATAATQACLDRVKVVAMAYEIEAKRKLKS